MSEQLNDKQMEAVRHTEGPTLIIAGAGSGKTKVLIHRIAHLIEDRGIMPWNILAITFTNKAAAELKERVHRLVGAQGEQVWVATFHSTCVRILRRFIDRIGFESSFTIYDTDDQKSIMTKLFKEMHVDTRFFKERAALSYISSCKNELMSPDEAFKIAVDKTEKEYARVYLSYQEAMKKNNALDFDDLIGKTVELFEKDAEVLDYYQEKFHYIMVDEYQDTNIAQFRLIELLAKKYRNICVVGDDDQSIYRFRGATVENILGFDVSFSGTKIIKLEQNYRSMGNILQAANSIIAHNVKRRGKNLWTQEGEGDPIEIRAYPSGKEEASNTMLDILRKKKKGMEYRDFAILYRTNAQSRQMEEQCIMHGIPYRLVGGVNFYQRKEIKDILAYVKTIVNERDDVAFLRIINTPKRGIGQATVDKITAYASIQDIGLPGAAVEMLKLGSFGRSGAKIEAFTDMIFSLKEKCKNGCNAKTMIEEILEKTEYKNYLYEEESDEEAKARLENIEELLNKAGEYEDQPIERFLEDVALIADIDSMDSSENRITLMTLHAAKGLEFEHVYLVGMEEGLFPSNMSIGEIGGIEEERRLCYVGITRAQRHLTLSYAKSRMLYGRISQSMPSRFLSEIPTELCSAGAVKGLEGENFSGRGAKKEAGTGYENWRSKESGRYPMGSSIGSGQGTNTSYKKVEAPNIRFGKEFRVEKPKQLDYAVNDRVQHDKFGIGQVVDIIEGKKDFEVTVDFETAGRKKVLSTFANLKKI